MRDEFLQKLKILSLFYNKNREKGEELWTHAHITCIPIDQPLTRNDHVFGKFISIAHDRITFTSCTLHLNSNICNYYVSFPAQFYKSFSNFVTLKIKQMHY